MSQILIQGGRVIDPGRGFDQTADVLIRDGVIAEIGSIPPSNQAKRIDADGCIVAPGLIDIHVHLREPDPEHDETVASGAAAAIAGGFTTICCMPNTHPPIDTAEMVEFVQHKAEQANRARVFVVGCATHQRRGERLAAIRSMAEVGAVAFSDDGDCVADASMMDHVLRTVHEVDRCFMQHCQEPTLTKGASMNAGVTATP
ncbi:MAG: amidohydrolase family protein, partial [Planctomycetes bacterium]|nr:amidohydrolase family protein [Planctomycetota bacterium]